MLIKKYTNRRLYDTDASCYITLEDLAQRVKDGAEVRVVDAKSGADLTQPTLTQILMESRGGQALLPAPLLRRPRLKLPTPNKPARAASMAEMREADAFGRRPFSCAAARVAGNGSRCGPFGS